MGKHSTLDHDKEGPQPFSRAISQEKMALMKNATKKPTRLKATQTTTVGLVERLKNSPLRIDNLEACIMKRANELAQHRGTDNSIQLHDWLIAAREVLSEES